MGEFGVLFCLIFEQIQKRGWLSAMDLDHIQPDMLMGACIVCPVEDPCAGLADLDKDLVLVERGADQVFHVDAALPWVCNAEQAGCAVIADGGDFDAVIRKFDGADRPEIPGDLGQEVSV
jgi:hypothetical protein